MEKIMPGNSTSATIKQIMADGLETLHDNVTDFVGSVATSEIVAAIIKATDKGGFLSGAWGGTTWGKQDRENLEKSLAAAGISGDMQKASAIIFEALGGKISSQVVDTITKYIVAPVINVSVGLVKGICTAVEKAAQGLNWAAGKAAEGLSRAAGKAAQGLEAAGQKFKKFTDFLSNTLESAKKKIEVAAKEASTKCKEAYNKAVVKTQERYAKFQKSSTISKGARHAVHYVDKLLMGNNEGEKRRADKKFQEREARIKSGEEATYKNRLRDIAKSQEVRKATLGIQGIQTENDIRVAKKFVNKLKARAEARKTDKGDARTK